MLALPIDVIWSDRQHPFEQSQNDRRMDPKEVVDDGISNNECSAQKRVLLPRLLRRGACGCSLSC